MATEPLCTFAYPSYCSFRQGSVNRSRTPSSYTVFFQRWTLATFAIPSAILWIIHHERGYLPALPYRLIHWLRARSYSSAMAFSSLELRNMLLHSLDCCGVYESVRQLHRLGLKRGWPSSMVMRNMLVFCYPLSQYPAYILSLSNPHNAGCICWYTSGMSVHQSSTLQNCPSASSPSHTSWSTFMLLLLSVSSHHSIVETQGHYTWLFIVRLVSYNLHCRL